MSKKTGKLILRFCPEILNGLECMDEKCPYVHTKSQYISMEEVLQTQDKFIRQDQVASARPVHASVSNTKDYILNQNLERPYLCVVCGKPVKEDGLFLTCCKMYCCSECYGNWKFPGRCPRCAAIDSAQIIDNDGILDLKVHNIIFNNFTIIQYHRNHI